MSDFKVKMHQNQFRLGLCPRPHWGSLHRSSRPPSWNEGALLLREGEEKGRGGKKGEGREGRGERRGREGRKGMEGETRHTNFNLLPAPLVT